MSRIVFWIAVVVCALKEPAMMPALDRINQCSGSLCSVAGCFEYSLNLQCIA